jgi:chemotaxis methyl-accepting protein methylase
MPSDISKNIDDYEPLLVALQNVLGVIVPDCQRSYFLERIETLLSSYKLDSFRLLAEKLKACDADICVNVLDAISQRQPDWFLNDEAKNILRKYIFPQLPDKAKIWIVGCGQGQLAYSFVMEIDKYEQQSGKTKNFQLIATDVLLDDINQAELAIYNKQQLSLLCDGDKKRYFMLNEKAGSGQVKEKFRQQITFSQCDLIEGFQSLGKMDLIFCPKDLVYFSNSVKAGIIQQFSGLLNYGGIFLTGSSQGVIPFSEVFERVEHPAGVFYRKKA